MIYLLWQADKETDAPVPAVEVDVLEDLTDLDIAAQTEILATYCHSDHYPLAWTALTETGERNATH